MRTISSVALAKLRTRLGTEPVVIIEVQWVQDGGWQMYADRDVGTSVSGKILTLGNIDDVIAITEHEGSQELEVTLDDTDGSLKTIMDTHDIHKRNVRVWQWFDGLDLSDKFLLFRGKINSPIEWNEGDQTLSFNIVTQLEGLEFGFSPEEGQFDFIPDNLIGQPWPSIFGKPLDVPVVRIGEAVHGNTLAGLGIITPGGTDQLGTSGAAAAQVGMASVMAQKGHISFMTSVWVNKDEELYDRYNKQYSEMSASISQALGAAVIADTNKRLDREDEVSAIEAGDLGQNPVRILGGEYFPRGSITLQIGAGTFGGYFGSGGNDNLFYITGRGHAENNADLAASDEAAESMVRRASSIIPGQHWNFCDRVPNTGLYHNVPKYHKTEGFSTGAAIYPTVWGALPKYTWINAGSNVTLVGIEPITYIVSIVPGTVKSVKAFRTFNGTKHFVDVPSNLYTVQGVWYGAIYTVQVVINKTLSTHVDQNWDDDIYVTFESSVGPNIVEILEYIIDRYTDFSVDSTSFNIVKALLATTPANFAVLDRKNVLTILQEIAFQACCNLRLINGVFYLTYLPEEPTSVDTITEGDIEVNSMSITSSATEDIVTKMIVEWRETYAKDVNKMILRLNVKKYGIQEETYDFYIYNSDMLVQKAATYWLIRKANTWKHISFTTFMNKLNLEGFDCVTLQFDTSYVANGQIKAILTHSEVDTESYKIQMDCWLPVKFGETTEYNFAWPTSAQIRQYFPTPDEIAWGYAGGGGIGVDAAGYLPLAPKNGGKSFRGSTGGSSTQPTQDKTKERREGTNKGKSDRGNPEPYRKGMDAEEANRIARHEAYAEAKKQTTVSNTTKPAKPAYAEQSATVVEPHAIPVTPRSSVGGASFVDLHATIIMDAKDSETVQVRLSDVFEIDSDSEKLCIKTNTKFKDSENTEEFDFKYDDEGEKWGAGTAFLKAGE